MPQHTIDTDELVANGLEALDEMSPRRYNDSRNSIYSCSRCNGLVVVPDGHVVLEDDDKDLICHECDKPVGLKSYRALVG